MRGAVGTGYCEKLEHYEGRILLEGTDLTGMKPATIRKLVEERVSVGDAV